MCNRDLPWRHTQDPYQILVSEVMLQQTQVARVDGRWQRWCAMFPTVDALAAAETSLVLQEWQGMGYNRRALNLKRACEIASSEYSGVLPCTYDELIALPGIGPSTAAGVMAFAYGRPAMYLETNVRCVFLHLLFPEEDKVPDKELIPYVSDACPEDDARAWYYALLDYGAYLKSTAGGNQNASRRSAAYSRQSRFEGSNRQKRAFLLRCVLEGDPLTVEQLQMRLDDFEASQGRERVETSLVESLLRGLVAEGFFCESDGAYRCIM